MTATRPEVKTSWVRPDWDDEESVKWFKERSKILSATFKAKRTIPQIACRQCASETPETATFHRCFRGHHGEVHFCSLQCLQAWQQVNELPSPPRAQRHVARMTCTSFGVT